VSVITILLATRHGVRFLPSQLRSLEAQTWPEVDLHVSDDGSTDGTRQHLETYLPSWTKGRTRLLVGPQEGTPAANFRALIVQADDASDYYAFCDQDDVWLPDKLANAVGALAHADANRPALHCARTQLIDTDGRVIGLSKYFTRPPGFRNAIIQSLAGGNTMVMNKAAFSILRAASLRTGFVAHDWWTYMLVSGAGGTIVYSDKVDTKYRQHEGNVTGSNLGWRARLTRLLRVWQGRFRDWNERNTAALLACEDLLSENARAVLRDFGRVRDRSLFERFRHLSRSGVYRQTIGGQVMLYIACAFRRI
jgi:glycosyltransferase involved in cell wall biosynthesis